MAGVLPALLIAGMPWTVVGATAFLAAVSFADDRKGLPIAARFGAHFVAAGLLLAAVAGGAWSWFGGSVTGNAKVVASDFGPITRVGRPGSGVWPR